MDISTLIVVLPLCGLACVLLFPYSLGDPLMDPLTVLSIAFASKDNDYINRCVSRKLASSGYIIGAWVVRIGGG